MSNRLVVVEKQAFKLSKNDEKIPSYGIGCFRLLLVGFDCPLVGFGCPLVGFDYRKSQNHFDFRKGIECTGK